MQKLLLFSSLMAFLLFGCKKDKGIEDLTGTWKMVQYYDRASNSINNKPATSPEMYLEIEANTFKAYSTYSQRFEGTFTLDTDKITFTGTNNNFDIINDPWADMFMWAIQACTLQSAYPCKPSTLEWQHLKRIRINTPFKMDIILKKI
jgi:hypothetical protein